ncbi:hypothetical protein [Microbispora catharanthi]|uniref:hypothetical protein n=1 Tax=Microbispora catharanthi TaxID=1712871 RepID=UPI0013775B77|nr:hypothetical protein [Microbispora catharanthi]
MLLRSMAGAPLGALSARGLWVAGAEAGVAVDAAGHATVTGPPPGLDLDVL